MSMSPAQPTPLVGMGATICYVNDRYPATIIQLIGLKTVVVQEDRYRRTDSNGLSEDQSYDYKPNPSGMKRTFTLRKSGRWVEKGADMRGTGLRIGEREAYRDPHI